MMDYQTTQLGKKYVIGIPVRTTNATFYQDVSPIWQRFQADQIPNRINQEILAVYTGYEGDHTKPFTYLMACEVSNLSSIPPGFQGLEIPPATYALFPNAGPHPTSLINTWQWIWTANLPRTYTTDFEVYGPAFNPSGPTEVPLYISLKR